MRLLDEAVIARNLKPVCERKASFAVASVFLGIDGEVGFGQVGGVLGVFHKAGDSEACASAKLTLVFYGGDGKRVRRWESSGSGGHLVRREGCDLGVGTFL